MSEEVQGPPLAVPDDDGEPLGQEAELARVDAVINIDGDLPSLVCPICGLTACKHNLPLVEAAG